MNTPVLVRHDENCPVGNRHPFGGHSDAARRVSDTYELHRAADPTGSIGQWFAVSLSEGRTDGVLYGSKRDCVLHQHHNEWFYAYVCVSPSSMSVCAADSFLKTHRAMYDKGIRLADPQDRHGGRDIIRRLTCEDQRSLTRSILRGGRASNLDYHPRG